MHSASSGAFSEAQVRADRPLPLFERFPRLAALPHLELARAPSPVQSLDRLSSELGCAQLHVKRDDLLGAELGGNKLRKLEFSLGAAQAAGATAILTAGSAGSNHVLATAVHGQKFANKVVCLIRPQLRSRAVRENLLLAARHGAELVPYPKDVSLHSKGPTVAAELQRLREAGYHPYFVPYAGMGFTGGIGFVSAAFELADAIAEGALPAPDSVYIALASMGSAAGLAVGLRAAGIQARIVAVRVVSPSDASDAGFSAQVSQMVAFLRDADPSFPAVEIEPDAVWIRDDQLGGGYGRFTDAGFEAARRLRDAHGIVLDGSYTAKAFAALLSDAQRGLAGRCPLFWHTGVRRGARESALDSRAGALPDAPHQYFEGSDLDGSQEALDSAFAELHAE
jgi:1-aminocyclopropane-1-carboxylate deaminase/D-cysteine desulfhydrase-like pyridoxal-dependent ACC family enzyme